MTSQVLRALEHKGLIDRAADPADTRAKRLRVTSRGAELAPRAIDAVERVDAAFFAGVAHANLLTVLRQLASPARGGAETVSERAPAP